MRSDKNNIHSKIKERNIFVFTEYPLLSIATDNLILSGRKRLNGRTSFRPREYQKYRSKLLQLQVLP